jgi:hypothetical protein
MILINVRSYHPHDFNVPDNQSQFTVAISIVHSLDSLILHASERGCALDSSWRNKSENRAATTILSTVNSSMHMLPGNFHLLLQDILSCSRQWQSRRRPRIR